MYFSCVFSYIAIAGYTNIIKQTAIAEAGLKVHNVFGKEAEIDLDLVRSNDSPSSYLSSTPRESGTLAFAESTLPAEVHNKKTASRVTISSTPQAAAHKSQLDDEGIAYWKERLQQMISEKRLYEQARLTLADVAKELGATTKFLLFLATLLSINSVADAQISKLDSMVEAAIGEKDPALFVGVVQEGEITYKNIRGMASVQLPPVPTMRIATRATTCWPR